MRRLLPRLALTAALLAGALTGAPACAVAAVPSQVTGASDVIGQASWWVSWLDNH